MKYDPEKHHRRSIRLRGYDYSQPGAYFVTICAYQRQCLFGEIVDRQMRLNRYGEIVAETYQWLCQRYGHLHSDEWIIMPNHFHAIMVITDKPCRGVCAMRSKSFRETPLRQMNNTTPMQLMNDVNHWDV